MQTAVSVGERDRGGGQFRPISGSAWLGFPLQPPPPLVGSAGQERKGASDMRYITLPPLSVSLEKKAIKG